ncbi:hypothetical protein V8D89_003089, partial [Ganoderma adspersum]
MPRRLPFVLLPFSSVSCAPGHPNSTINTAGNVACEAANAVCRWVGDLPSRAREHHKSSDLDAVQPGEDANTAPPAAESLLALGISTGHCTNNTKDVAVAATLLYRSQPAYKRTAPVPKVDENVDFMAAHSCRLPAAVPPWPGCLEVAEAVHSGLWRVLPTNSSAWSPSRRMRPSARRSDEAPKVVFRGDFIALEKRTRQTGLRTPTPAGQTLTTKCTVYGHAVPTVLGRQNRVLKIRPKAGTRSPAGDAPTPSAGVSLPERIQTARRSFALTVRGSSSQKLAASSRKKRGSSCRRARPEFTPATNAAGFVRIGRGLKNRTKRRFHCARKVRSANTTPRGQSGRANASDRVQDARTGCADGPGPPEPRPRNVPKGGYTVDCRLRADTVLGTDISYRGHIRAARRRASPPSGALAARISDLAGGKNGDRAVGAVSGPAVCQGARSRRRARRPPPTTRGAGKRVGTTAGTSHEGETTAVASGIAVCAETDGVWCAPETRIVFTSNAGGLGTNGRGSKNGGFERFHCARTRAARNSRITLHTAGRTLRMKCVVLGRAVRTVYGPRNRVLKFGFWAGTWAPDEDG